MADTDAPVPGWYPAAHAEGELRYWDGEQWLDGPPAEPDAVTEVVEEDAESAIPASPSTTARSEKSGSPAWLQSRRGLVLAGVAAVVLGLLVGAGVAAAVVVPQLTEAQDEAAGYKSDLHDTRRLLDQAEDERDSARASYATLETQTRTREAELDRLEAELEEREAAVKATEDAIAANQFGEGIQIVGETVAAGTYRTGQISGMCYYVWKTGTGSDADIIDNNIVESGTATVTLRDGDVFESSGCGTWGKV